MIFIKTFAGINYVSIRKNHNYVVNFRTFGTFSMQYTALFKRQRKKFEINEYFLAISVRKENRLNP